MNVPLVGGCPEWDDEIPAHRLDEFNRLLRAVYQDVRQSAARTLINRGTPCDWHRALFAGFVPINYYAGNYRQVYHLWPCLAKDVEVAGIPGCPHQLNLAAVESLFSAIRAQLISLELRWAEIPPRQRALQLSGATANLVGGLIQIHPFLNGNGRTSRLLWRWVLLRFGVPPQVTCFPRPGQPYEQLMAHAMYGDFRPLAISVLMHLGSHPPDKV